MYSSADHTQFQINFQTDNSQTAFFEVFTLNVPVVSATCPGGGAGSVGQPDNNPDEFECQISPAASSGMVTVTTDSSPAALEQCGANIANQASFDNSTYTAQNPVVPVSGNCSPPVAAFTVSSGQTAGSPVSFDGSESTDPNPGGGITAYSWDFGDGSPPVNGAAATATHTYAQPGTYQVKLTVTDKEGGTAPITHPVTVASASGQKPPVAAFTVSSGPTAGRPVSFDGSGSRDPNPDEHIKLYRWDFGDGSPPVTGGDAEPTATHTYTKPGTYTATLTVTGSEGGTASVTHTITVAAAPKLPVNTGLPQISGDLTVGGTLTASHGSWTTSSPLSFAYQWQDCDAKDADCHDISAATSSSYVPDFAEIGKRLRVIVTATNAGGSTSAASDRTATVDVPPETVGSPSTSGSTTTLPVQCTSPLALGGQCAVLLLLYALGGGQPSTGPAADLAIATRPKPRVLGKTKAKIPVGHTKDVRITLNKAGRRLLKKRHTLKVRLTITEKGHVLLTRTIVFKAKKHH